MARTRRRAARSPPIPILNVYYLLCHAWRQVQERDTKRLASLADLSTVHDLLGKILAAGVNHLVCRGIDRGSVERREDLAGIRGKLAVSETAKRALRSRARAAGDFEELSVDILPNRIMRTSLRSLLNPRITRDRSVRGEVHSAYRKLGESTPPRASPPAVDDDHNLLFKKNAVPGNVLSVVNPDGRLQLPDQEIYLPHRRFLEYHREHVF